MYDMVNIFEVFLPQLLRYPNPADPLNGEAAAMLLREPKAYDAKVKGEFPRNLRTVHMLISWVEYVGKYASKEAADEAGEDNETDDEMSEAGSYRSDGEEDQPAGEMEEL